jgi:two-component system, sensor histidine kinase PdtaS
MDIIYELCKQYSDLADDEIASIRIMSSVLQSLANLEDADVFIDCPSENGDSIVVAEAKPSGVPSSYKNSVVGMMAKKENEPAVARTMRLGIPTKHMKALTQENTYVIQSVEPINNGSRVIGTLIRERRMEEQYAIGERLHLSEQSYKTIANVLNHMGDENSWLTECIEEALLMINHEGIVTFRNSIAKDLYKKLGYIEDVLGQSYGNICLIKSDQDNGKQLHEKGNNTFTETVVGKHTLSISNVYLGRNDIAFAVIIRDMTWMREQEKELILKSVAIKEMHHRVKNNLQTIASLLRLQIRRTENEETKTVLEETMNRILSIAVTHQLLAQSGIDYVKIGEVILNIKNNVTRYFYRPQYNIDVIVEGDDFEVESDIATSVALVINELLQNSLKYAFTNRNTGEVRIIVSKGSLYSKIKMIDNGCGFDLMDMKQEGLGLKIVHSLVEDKLHGNLKIKSNKQGTTVSFDFINKTIDVVGAT